MFQSLFANIKSLAIKLFLGLIALSFAVWGVGDIFRGGNDPVVASIGKIDIKASQIATSYNRELEQLRRLTNGQINAEQARALGIVENTLQQLINRGVMDIQSRQFQLAASDKMVAEEIRNSSNFQNEFGKFDRNIFEYSIRQSGMTEEDFIELVRQDLVRDQLVDSLLTGIHSPKILGESLTKYETEKRSASFVIFDKEVVGEAPVPSSLEVQEFYDENSHRFMSEPYRSASYIELRPSDFISEIQISEDILNSEYEFQIDRFTVEDRIDLDLMVFDDQDSAFTAIDRINAGEDFLTVGVAMTSLTESDLSLGLVTRGSLLPELDQIAFNTLAGNTTEPIETDFGWYLIRVNSLEEGGVQNFSEVKGIIYEEIATEKAIELIYELSNRLEDNLAAGNTLEETARLIGVELRTLPLIDQNGFTENGDLHQHLPPSNDFLETVFATEAGVDIPLTEVEGNAIFKIRVDEIVEPRLNPLDSVTDLAVTSWQRLWQDEQSLKIATKFTEVVASTTFDEAVEQMGLSPFGGAPFTRTGDELDFDVNQQAIDAVFSLSVGDITKVIKLGSGRYVVGTLNRILTNDTVDDSEFERISQELKVALQTDILALYQMALRQRYKLTVNDQALANLF